MSRFDDLDAHLRREAALQEQRADTLAKNRLKFIEACGPLLAKTNEVVTEYYATILEPRTDLRRVKKRETNLLDLSSLGSHRIFVTNFVHKEDAPYGSDGWGDHYLVPGPVEQDSWHPNVALQVRTDLKNNYDQVSSSYTGVRADLLVSFWGVIPQEYGALMTPGLQTEIVNGWNKDYTRIFLTGNKNNPEETANLLGKTLMLATPYVLGHREIIRGSKRMIGR